MKIKKKLRSIKCLEGVFMLRRFYHDEGLRQICRGYCDENIQIVYYKMLDSHNESKLVLRIPVKDDMAGFFCNYFCMLNGILEFEACGLPMVVDWMDSPYREPEPFKGTQNPFEYYFKPISKITLKELQFDFQPVEYNRRITGFTYLECHDEIKLERLAKINNKYIHLREDVREQLSLEINLLLGGAKRTVAVHVRGVEWGQVIGHPVPAALKSYITYIDEALEKYGFEKIFLATDSEDTVIHLRERYGEKLVCFTDTMRSECGSNTLIIFNKKIERPHHHYRLGYEVLRDVATMSCCDGFIGGFSNVASAAEVFKMSRGQKFEYKAIIQQKMQREGIGLRKAKHLMEKGKYHGGK